MRINSKKTNKKWQKPIAIIIVVGATFLWSDFLISKTNNILHPVRLKVYETTSNIKGSINNFLNIKENLQEKERLEQLLEKKVYEAIVDRNILEENKKLRELLDIKEKSKYQMIISQIIYIDSLDPYDVITIDKGKNDGIEHNMAVTSSQGLVGRIKKAYKTYSVVELITSTSSHTSAIDKTENSLSILSGQGNDILNLEYIVVDDNVKVGDKIYTSGVSNIYMKNIPLGSITSIENNDKMFKEITVKLPYNIFNLKNVMVIKKEN